MLRSQVRRICCSHKLLVSCRSGREISQEEGNERLTSSVSFVAAGRAASFFEDVVVQRRSAATTSRMLAAMLRGAFFQMLLILAWVR
jgi:hypothetical protein